MQNNNPRKFQNRYQRTRPTPTTILRWAYNFINLGSFENRAGHRRHRVFEQRVQKIIYYFCQQLIMTLKREIADLEFPYYAVQTIMKLPVPMTVYKITRIQNFNKKIMLNVLSLLIRIWTICRPILVPFVRCLFLMNVYFTLGICEHSEL